METSSDKSFSIIIPTYCEAKNIHELIKRISQIDFGEHLFEVILVDDQSQDGIETIVHHLSIQHAWLKLIIRKGRRSLSASVMEGFNHAKYAILIVMDADLSHPPENILNMLQALTTPDVDMVIGSRYVEGGGVDMSWPLARKFSSKLAAFITRLCLSTQVRDPLSGFLAIKKTTLYSGSQLKPIGWKIGLEIITKCHCKKIQEIPIYFSERYQGLSKLDSKVILNCLLHILNLMGYKIFQQLRVFKKRN